MTAATTLPRLLHCNAVQFGGRPALREKRGGIWQVLTWADYATLASRFAAGLAAHGFGQGERLAVIGDNRPKLYAALLAAQSLGGVGVPLSPDAEPDWIGSVLSDAGVSIVVAEDAEQAEKIVEVKERLPQLRLIVQTTSHGMRQIEQDRLKSFDSVIADAADAIDRSAPGDAALLLYDRNADAAALTHAGLLAAAETLMATEQVRQADEAFAWLPMAWFADALSSLALALSVGFTCNCPEHPETVWRDLREIGPTVMIAPSRVWEDMLTDIEARGTQATPLKRLLFKRFRAVAMRGETSGDATPLALRLKLALGEALVYAPLRDQIGLRRLRWANTGGEKLPPRVLQEFRALGINLKESAATAEPVPAAWEPAHA